MSIIGNINIRAISGQSKASPALGKTLGALEINMMGFLKEFNARTTKVRPNVNMQTVVTPRTDKSYKFTIRSPEAQWFIKRASRIHTGSKNPITEPASYVLTKELFHVAKVKCMDPQLLGMPTYNIMKALIGTSRGLGVVVSDQPDSRWAKRDNTMPGSLEELRKNHKLTNKANKRAGGKK